MDRWIDGLMDGYIDSVDTVDIVDTIDDDR